MLRQWILPVSFALCAALAIALPAAAADQAKTSAKEDFRAARRDLQTRLHSRQSGTRAIAMRDLSQYPTPDAIKLLLVTLAKEQSEDVHEAAFETLLGLKDNAEVCQQLLAALHKDTQGNRSVDTTPMLLMVLLSSNLEEVDRETRELLDTLSTGRHGVAPLVMLVDQLGQQAKREDVTRLGKLAKLRAYQRDFGLRRAVAQALSKIPQPAAIGLLIEMLAGVQGEVAADVAQHLADVTKQPYGSNAEQWAQWWTDNKETFEFPQRVEHPEVRNIDSRGEGSESRYYGIRIYAQRMLFVMDVSGSMDGPRIVAAKRELLQAIEGLKSETYFGVLVFSSDVNAWQRQLVQATPANKQSAQRFVMSQQAKGSTATFDAVQAAFRFDAEAVYLLTDGMPNGRASAIQEIVNSVLEMNRSRRISLYTIGIGVGAPGEVFDRFLYDLAKGNWGVYRRVDQ